MCLCRGLFVEPGGPLRTRTVASEPLTEDTIQLQVVALSSQRAHVRPSVEPRAISEFSLRLVKSDAFLRRAALEHHRNCQQVRFFASLEVE